MKQIYKTTRTTTTKIEHPFFTSEEDTYHRTQNPQKTGSSQKSCSGPFFINMPIFNAHNAHLYQPVHIIFESLFTTDLSMRTVLQVSWADNYLLKVNNYTRNNVSLKWKTFSFLKKQIKGWASFAANFSVFLKQRMNLLKIINN